MKKKQNTCHLKENYSENKFNKEPQQQNRHVINLMPGPVFSNSDVNAAMAEKPVSHRTTAFKQILNQTRDMLCKLTQASHTVIALGSGTLANDFIAGQLKQIPGQGLILNNGEFGSRLADHATRMGLNFRTLEVPWGETFNEKMILQALAQGETKTWLWAVHAETSTGVLNDLDLLKQLSREIISNSASTVSALWELSPVI